MRLSLFIIILIFFSQINISAEVKLCAVGDILLDRSIKDHIIKNGNVDYPFRKIKKEVIKYDLAFCNLECPASNNGIPLNKTFSFHAEPEYLEGLKNAGFNLISIANNHTIDWGREAFLETKMHLERLGLYTVGGGKNKKEGLQATLVEEKGLKFAFIGSIDMLLEGLAYLEDRPAPPWATKDEIVNEIERVKAKVDYIIVSFHWGIEFNHSPTMNQIALAHELIDAGADLILGHHPHVLQAVEIYNERYIVYSLGNFIFDQHELYQRQTMIFSCKFTKNKIGPASMVPILINNFIPEIARKKDANKIVNKLDKLCREFNTKIKNENKNYVFNDLANRDVFDVPLCETRVDSNIIKVFKNRIQLFDFNQEEIDKIVFDDPEELKECCVAQENGEHIIYGILGNKEETRGKHIVIIPVSENGFLKQLKDSRILNPWKIILADVDGDDKKELCVGVWKNTRYDSMYDNRLFIYNRDGHNIYPKWLGSKFQNSFIDFDFQNVNNDKENELILLEKDQNENKNVVSYKWNSFGFIDRHLIKSNYKNNNLFNWNTENN
ncbi:MAG: CapA family protein [bacterium]